jgi:hypothetical protein
VNVTGSTPKRYARNDSVYTLCVTRLVRRSPSWLPWLLAASGGLGLLLPWLLSPVNSDEISHYPTAPMRMEDNLFNVLPWTINDIGWRMAAGRIAPIGVFVQHVVYLLGMQFAFSTGVPLFIVHGFVKLLLLAAVVGSFALLLRQLRRSDNSDLDRPTRATAISVFSALLVSGVTASSPGTSGWMTFVVLCIGGIPLMFLVGAASLWTLGGWSRWRAFGKAISGAAMLALGAVVMLSYELHWAAVPFAIILVLAGPAIWWHRLVLGSLLGTGWLTAVLWTRALIAAVSQHSYVGLELDLRGPIARVVGLQLINAVPGSGISHAARTLGSGLPVPGPFDGSGWLWGALLAFGLALLVHSAPQPTAEEVRADRRPLTILSAALAAAALGAAVIVSVSKQAHEMIIYLGASYRATPWIWMCIAGTLTAGLLALRGGRWTRLHMMAVPAAIAVFVGVAVWPATVSEIKTQRVSATSQIWEQAQAELIAGSADALAVDHRCRLVKEATDWAGQSIYRGNFLKHYEASFEHQWRRPWCEWPRSGPRARPDG